MSTNASTDASNNTASASSSVETPQKVPLALPEVAYNGTTTLDMSNGNTSVKLDHLGPMVVSVDGTLSRISNWEGMTDMEKESTFRIIGKRNQARLEVLKAKEKLKEEGGK